MHRLIIVLVMAASLGVTGCASKRPKPAPSTASNAATAGATGSGANSANAGSANAEDEAAGPQGGLLATRIVYFEFDSSEVRGAGVELVAAHARFLAANPGTRVRLEGHTDERGSREYNIGLGERRAQAVRRALMLQGALDGQISTVSYGEERPAAPGHDDDAWAKNRRVEIVYLAGGTPPQAAPAHR
jgi:peptidoglycan-associated lipoprotein